jgi:hypothetical protein
MSIFNYPGAATITSVSASASQAATFNSAAIDMRDYDGPVVFVQNKGTGTGTLDGKIQDSDDGSTGWADVTGAVFIQAGVGADTQKLVVGSKTTRRFTRYTGTIVTGPHLLSVSMLGVKKAV